jgi:hypothetical protein
MIALFISASVAKAERFLAAWWESSSNPDVWSRPPDRPWPWPPSDPGRGLHLIPVVAFRLNAQVSGEPGPHPAQS